MNCIHIHGFRYGLFSEFQWPIVEFLPNIFLNAHHRNNKDISFTPFSFLRVRDGTQQQSCRRGEAPTLSVVSPVCLSASPCHITFRPSTHPSAPLPADIPDRRLLSRCHHPGPSFFQWSFWIFPCHPSFPSDIVAMLTLKQHTSTYNVSVVSHFIIHNKTKNLYHDLPVSSM